MAYADIIGYTKWQRQPLSPPRARENFLDKFYDEMGWFVLSSDFKVKYMGDGFMVIRELNEYGRRVYDALRFLFGIDKLVRRIQTLIQESEFPPEGIRVRAVVGPADKKMATDPNNKEKFIEEYNSTAIDLAQRLLQVKPKTLFICHRTVINLIGKKFPHVLFKELGRVVVNRGRIDPEELKGLCELNFERAFHIA